MLIYFFDLKRVSPPLNIYAELERMLALRKLNWSYNELSKEFHVPKTTIRYLVRRFGIAGRFNPPTLPHHRSTTRSTPKISYTKPTENDYSTKTYADYIRDEKERKWRKLTQGHIKS